MVLPTTEFWALLLLVAAFVGLSSWVNLYKLSAPGWRFELFYFDFAMGAMALAIIAAYTFGTLGSEIAFSDRIQVAGRTSQILAVSGGFVFNIGNMLLLAAVSVIGTAAAFPLAAGIALLINAALDIRGSNSVPMAVGIILIAAATVAVVAACRVRSPSRKSGSGAATKGMIAAAVGGLFMSPLPYFYRKSMSGDLSLGPYGGLLMMALGGIVSTAFFSIYFFNIAIEGAPVNLKSYARGTVREHLNGAAAGMIFAGGALAELLAISQLSPSQASGNQGRLALFSAPALATILGLLAWREFGRAPQQARRAMWLSSLLFVAGVVTISYAW